MGVNMIAQNKNQAAKERSEKLVDTIAEGIKSGSITDIRYSVLKLRYKVGPDVIKRARIKAGVGVSKRRQEAGKGRAGRKKVSKPAPSKNSKELLMGAWI